MSLKMLAHTVGVSEGRAVAQLRAVAEPDDEEAGGGTATIIVRGDDAAEAFEEGCVYEVSFSKTTSGVADAYTKAAAARAAAAAIPNSTNTRNYKTPPELKVVPPALPDGVVTLPRPTVVLPPLTDTPPDAGVVSGPSTNPAPQSPQTPQQTRR